MPSWSGPYSYWSTPAEQGGGLAPVDSETAGTIEIIQDMLDNFDRELAEILNDD